MGETPLWNLRHVNLTTTCKNHNKLRYRRLEQIMQPYQRIGLSSASPKKKLESVQTKKFFKKV